jgi:hypothetical protein
VKGDRYEWSQTTSQKINQTIAGMEQNIENSVQGTMTLKVIELTSTGARFEIEYTKLYTKIKLPMGEMIMDTEGDSSSVLNKVLIAMKGKKFNFSMTRNGFVESVDNMDNLWSGINSKIGISEAQVSQIKQSLEQSFGKSSFKGNLQSALPYYPENKVHVGSTWTNSTGIGMNFPIDITNTWTLDSFTDRTAVTSSVGR